MKMKELWICGKPVTDSNFEPVNVTKTQANAISRKQEAKYRRLLWGKDAHGFVFETERYFNVSVGFGKVKNV